MTEKIAVLEAAHYEETRERLAKDEIVLGMIAEIDAETRAWLVETGGDWNFTLAAMHEYNRRGGTGAGHIGAVKEAIVRVLRALAIEV